MPQVDADGNDIGGIRSVFLQVPVGTYTGWNPFQSGFFGGGQCNLGGSFIPFAATRAEREARGDARLSIEERYPDKQAYVAAFRTRPRDWLNSGCCSRTTLLYWFQPQNATASARGRKDPCGQTRHCTDAIEEALYELSLARETAVPWTIFRCLGG